MELWLRSTSHGRISTCRPRALSRQGARGCLTYKAGGPTFAAGWISLRMEASSSTGCTPRGQRSVRLCLLMLGENTCGPDSMFPMYCCLLEA